MKTTRSLIKHTAEPFIYCIECDDEGFILAAMDVTKEAESGGLCPHMLAGLPLAGAIEDVERLNRERDSEWNVYTTDCGNVHHLMADLINAEKDHRAAAAQTAMAESKFRSLKKDTELKAAKVHDILGRLADRKPLPLFEPLG